MITHLVTSGCSFSDNYEKRWPHFLAERLNAGLYNRGQGSCGNSWIAKTAIFQTQTLIDNGVDPKNILVAVMWSGIDRKDLFISPELPDFATLHNPEEWVSNPVNFIDTKENESCSMYPKDGYLSGSMHDSFTNQHISRFNRHLISKFYCNENLAIQSYENMLRLQWYCASMGIKLINQTYMDIMHYPACLDILNRWVHHEPMTYDIYRNVKYLYDMINFKDWVFWKESSGLYEYCKDQDLTFYDDHVHPSVDSHEYYVDNFLLSQLKGKGKI